MAAENQDSYIDSIPDPSDAQPQTEPPAVRKVKSVENKDESTPKEIGEVCIQLRRLSPDISINPFVMSAIRLF